MLFFTLLNLLISFLTSYVVPYLGSFPYKGIIDQYHLPPFVSSFANFDGVQYLIIAGQGYVQYSQAFFPLYPILIRYVGLFFQKNYFLTGLCISNLAFLAGYFVFKKYIDTLVKKPSDIKWILILLICFPTSFFFNAIYTESLFFLLAISSLYCFRKKHYVYSGILAYLAALTRLIGVFLVIPFFVEFIYSFKLSQLAKKDFWDTFFSIKKQLQSFPRYYFYPLLGPILGLITYSIYLWDSTSDPIFYFHAQPAFGANRSTSLILLPQVLYRYLKIFITARHTYQYYISVTEFVIFNFVFGILLWELFTLWKNKKTPEFAHRLGLNLFSLVNIVLPTLTGTFSSIPRYALMSFSFFIFLGQLKNPFVKEAITLFFFGLHIFLLALFVQGYFVS